MKNQLNRENWKKNNWKNRTVKKNRPVQFGFGFISLKLKKQNRTQTEKNRKKTKPNQKKTVKTEPNRAKPVWTDFCLKNELNRTKTGRFKPVSVFLLKKFNLIIFFNKNQIKPKIITHLIYTSQMKSDRRMSNAQEHALEKRKRQHNYNKIYKSLNLSKSSI